MGVATNNTEAWWFNKIYPDVPIYGFEPCDTRYNLLSDYPGKLSKMCLTDVDGIYSGYQNHYDFKVTYELDKQDAYIPVDVKSTTLDEMDKDTTVYQLYM